MEENGDMKYDDQHIDDLMKKAFEQQKFDYKSSYFAEMEKDLFPSSPKGDTHLAWYLVGAALLVMGFFCTKLPNASGTLQGAKIREVKWAKLPKIEKDNLPQTIKDKVVESSIKTLAKVSATRVKSSKENSTIFEKSMEIKNVPVDRKTTVLNTNEIEPKIDFQLNKGIANKINFNLAPKETNLVEAKKHPEYSIGKLNFLIQGKIPSKELENISLFKNLASSKRTKQGVFVTSHLEMGSARYENQSFYTKSLALGFGYTRNKGYWGASMAVLGEMNQDGMEFRQTTKHYSYNLDEHQNNLKYTSLYRVVVPLRLQLNIKKHQIHGGFAFAQMFHSKLNYSYMVNGVEKRRETIYGQSQGINPTTFTLQGGYGLKLTERLELGVSINYSLISKTKKRGFDQSTSVSPLSGQIYVRHLIRKL